MAYDIYGNDLRKGCCEVHPHVEEEYPCSLCINEKNKRDSRDENDSLLHENYIMFEILKDIRGKSFSDNQGNFICHIPKELKVKIDNILEVIKNDI